MLLTFAGVIGAVFLARSAPDETQSTGLLVFSVIVTLLFEALLLGIAWAFTAHRFGGGFATLGWRARPIASWIATTVLVVVGAFITLGLYSAVTSLPGLHAFAPESNVPNDLFKNRVTLIPTILITVVARTAGPEETFFRGFLFDGLRGELGFAGAATASGVLFALAHASPTLIIPFTVIGVLFAFAYRRTETLWTNAGAHFLFNLIGVVVALAGQGRS